MSDKNGITDVAPTSIRHLVGQRGVIAQVVVALDAAQMDGKKFEHGLLVGPPGLGKSALANIIANEMARDASSGQYHCPLPLAKHCKPTWILARPLTATRYSSVNVGH